MRNPAPGKYLAAWALAVVFIVLPGCSKKESFSKGRGVFYQRTESDLVLLFKGTATEMAPRAVSITGTRPTFLVNSPNLKMSEVRIAVDLADGKNGPFKRVDVTGTPVEGRPGVYTFRPNSDLPPGLCAIVLGSDDVLSVDKDNVYPFRIVGEKSAP